MLQFSLPDLSSNEVILQPEIRTVKGSSLTLGTPVAVRLTPKTVASYPEAVAFLDQEKRFGFYLVHLACSFHHQDAEPFEEAWLQVKLRRQNNLVEPPVIAWSLIPQKEEDTEEMFQSLKLGAKLKFVTGGFNSAAGVERKSKFRHSFLSAFGLQESEQYWYFRRLETRDIEGAFRTPARLAELKQGLDQLRLAITASRGQLTLDLTEQSFYSNVLGKVENSGHLFTNLSDDEKKARTAFLATL
jgi:hypothetical protein